MGLNDANGEVCKKIIKSYKSKDVTGCNCYELDDEGSNFCETGTDLSWSTASCSTLIANWCH